MARLPECQAFARRYGLKLITIEALVAWRKEHDEEFIAKREASKGKGANKGQGGLREGERGGKRVEMLAECKLPIRRGDMDLGEWTLRCYLSHLDGLRRHVALIKGTSRRLLSPVLSFFPFLFVFLSSFLPFPPPNQYAEADDCVDIP